MSHHPYPMQSFPYSSQQPYDQRNLPYQPPYVPQEPPHHLLQQVPTPFHQPHQVHDQLKRETLAKVEPFVQYGLKEAAHTSYEHALREVAAIALLMGRGYDPRTAHMMVESWEINEKFYPWERK